MDKALKIEVRPLANERCEYCRLPQAFLLEPFQFDHVIARKHGGPTEVSNVVFCCVHCNQHKGTDLSGIDPDSGQIVRLFHPRQDRWLEHFALRGVSIVGLTPIGRATVAVLKVNAPTLVTVRGVLIMEGVFNAPS
jgi:hypothetical protein